MNVFLILVLFVCFTNFAFCESNVTIAFCEDVGKPAGYVEKIFLNKKYDKHYLFIRDCFGKVEALKFKIKCSADTNNVRAFFDGSDDIKISDTRQEKEKEVYFPMQKHKFGDTYFINNLITRSATLFVENKQSSQEFSCTIEVNAEGYNFVQPKKFRCSNDSECGNGKCNHVLKKCICQNGYIGRHCEFPFKNNECEDNKDCTGNSRCWGETNQCLCDEGYYGYRCNLPRNDLILQTARDVKCVHGKIDQDFDFCTCDEGWTGTACNYNASKTCYSGKNPCKNGICDYKSGNCICEKGFYGNDCSISRKIYGSSCINHGCENGGICNEYLDICYCPKEFAGYYCELNSKSFSCSKDEHCSFPRGICEGGTGMCRCKDGFYGIKCEVDI